MNDPIGRHIVRLAGLITGLFLLLAGATFYWGFLRADALAARPDNPRRSAFDRRIARGRILDRHGAVLAETRFDEDGEPERVYHEPSAAPAVGFQTWRYGAGGSTRSTYGAGGAEAAYDVALRGDLGLSLRQLLAGQLLHRPQTGHDVVLTLDGELQRYGAELLGDREGAVVVLDVPTGAVRALVSEPTFDPASLDAGKLDPEDPRRPLLNRATQGLYPPGSIWKTVTLAGALAAGLASPSDMFDDGDAVEYFAGFPVRCNNNPEGVTRFDLAHAFGYSCNLTFARLGNKLGSSRYRQLAKDFGLGEIPPFPLPISRGSLSSHDELPTAELVSAAFGQGELSVTPLHMALVAAAAARDGTMPVPYLLEDVPGVDHRSLADGRGVWRRAMAPDVAREVRDIMVTSVEDGWARSAVAGLGITAGGKTGTAQLGEGVSPHSWFIGFAPADDPQVAVAVLVANGGEGAAVAAPIGGRILQRALDQNKEAPR
jgi:peptidoglycan glycosyltransferase